MLNKYIRENKEEFNYFVDDINVKDLNELIDIICNEIKEYEEKCYYAHEQSIFRILDFLNDMFVNGLLCNKEGDTIKCSEFIAFAICSTILVIYQENILD